MNKKVKFSGLWTAILSVVSVAYIFPILLVLINSFKKKAYISRYPFAIPTDKMFVGLENYVNGLTKTGFFQAFGWTLFITVFSVAVILLCTSMCAWYINRVTNTLTKTMYMLCLFSMVVPFQMVMFTLSKIANILKLNTPWGLIIIYLGYGAGLAVFMFSGFVKSIPIEIEEAAMIDGCTPIQTFFKVVLPVMKPTCVTVAILETMWIWNDYLLPYLVLDIKKYKTISIAIQYLKGGYGTIDMGAMMGVLVLSIIPIIAFYLACEKASCRSDADRYQDAPYGWSGAFKKSKGGISGSGNYHFQRLWRFCFCPGGDPLWCDRLRAETGGSGPLS